MIDIYKFGGTSLINEERIKQVIKVVKDCKNKLIIVISAIKNSSYSTKNLMSLINRELFNDEEYSSLISVGEIIASNVLCNILRSNNLKVAKPSLNQLKLQIDENKNYIYVDIEYIYNLFLRYDCIIVPGFLGLLNGEISILNFNDSDLTAVYLAKALNLNKVSLFKDGKGIYLNEKYQEYILKNIAYQEMDLLIKYGNNIVSKSANKLAKNHRIQINICSYFNYTCSVIEDKITNLIIKFEYIENKTILLSLYPCLVKEILITKKIAKENEIVINEDEIVIKEKISLNKIKELFNFLKE